MKALTAFGVPHNARSHGGSASTVYNSGALPFNKPKMSEFRTFFHRAATPEGETPAKARDIMVVSF
jgi:hypothetical protein